IRTILITVWTGSLADFGQKRGQSGQRGVFLSGPEQSLFRPESNGEFPRRTQGDPSNASIDGLEKVVDDARSVEIVRGLSKSPRRKTHVAASPRQFPTARQEPIALPRPIFVTAFFGVLLLYLRGGCQRHATRS